MIRFLGLVLALGILGCNEPEPIFSAGDLAMAGDLASAPAGDLACVQPQAPCVSGRDYSSCSGGDWRPCLNCGRGWKCDACGRNECVANADINGDGGM